MKQEIIKKLFDGEPLEGAEAAYVANNLKGGEENPVMLPPYDHTHRMTHDACGITDADLNDFVEIMKKLVDSKEDSRGISSLVETLEVSCRDKPLMIRIVILQFLKGMANRNPLAMLLGGLLGGRGL